MFEKGLKLSSVNKDLPSNASFNRNVVIWADPLFPPYSIPVLCSAISKQTSVFSSEHVHSSVKVAVPDHLHQFLPTTNNTDQPRGHFDWKITLIWKNVGRNPVLMLSPLNNQAIHGECNIGRYLARSLERSSSYAYETLPLNLSVSIDNWIDSVHAATHGLGNIKNIVERVKSSKSLVPEAPKNNLPDLLLASICKQDLRSELKELALWQLEFWN